MKFFKFTEVVLFHKRISELSEPRLKNRMVDDIIVSIIQRGTVFFSIAEGMFGS